MAAHHSITWIMIFSTSQLWSCAFSFWTYMSLGPGTQSLDLGLEHLSLSWQQVCYVDAAAEVRPNESCDQSEECGVGVLRDGERWGGEVCDLWESHQAVRRQHFQPASSPEVQSPARVLRRRGGGSTAKERRSRLQLGLSVCLSVFCTCKM